MARLDWAATPLGPVVSWPQSLRAAVRMVLSSRYPMLLLWGEEFSQLYNDAYSALIGDKHPAALGGDVRVTLAEGWNVLEPLIADAMATGVASWVPALQLLLDRAGYHEEAYFSVSHAPARDDDGRTVGVLTVCSEVTQQVIGERRLRLLRDLSLQGGGQTVDVDATCTRLAEAIDGHPLDVPFAAIYLRDGGALRRVACVGTDATGRPVSATLPAVWPPAVLPSAVPRSGPPDDDPWRLRPAAAGSPGEITGVASLVTVPAGPWDEPVGAALVLPLPSVDQAQPVGVLVAGVSPSRGLDEPYRSFFQLLTQQVSVAVRNAQAYEEERRRAEALAELDRVKTSFFTNVSHEFRTPLTLMLGPLGDALGDARHPLDAVQHERIDTAWRNAHRLLTLVNNLLTFSSLEAGRLQTVARTVDLAQLTAELAGVFRSAVERAGLRLVVDCPPLPRLVHTDPGNWEKILANLMSNALKFTFVGEIRVGLRADAERVTLTVADTGIGIGEQELTRLFDRFHRVQGARSRSHEGTGIGLALVRELTLLQGGDVHVDSRIGAGTTFTVSVPWTALEPVDPPPDDADGSVGPGSVGPGSVGPGSVGLGSAGPGSVGVARAAAQEAIGWLDDAVPEPPTAGGGVVDEQVRDARILVADDNADMRAYLSRLLTAAGWQVQTVHDGRQALDVIRRQPPDVVLTDVMMPVLDGFHLLREVRRDEATRALPVVVLSARAGQEASVEGLDLGADDYVVKPFIAAELLARLRRTLMLARVRGRHTRHLSALADTAAVITSGRALDDAVRTITEQARLLLGGVLAVTVLDGADGRPELRFVSPQSADVPSHPEPPPPAATPEPAPRRRLRHADVAEAEVRGRGGRRIGTLTVHTAEGRRLPEDERSLLLPLAQMVAALAENTWRVEHEQQVARTLQQSLLPERLPSVADWDLAAGHRSGTSRGEVGGDWYDAITLTDGRLVVSVGDTAGRGLDAAVTTGQVRNAVRAYAVEDPSPARVVARLGALLSRLGTPSYATLFLGYLDPDTGELTWCSAGHPPPVHAEADQPARWLDGVCGPPLGVLGGTPVENHTTLTPGARLLLHTDDTVRGRHRDPDAGRRRLLALVDTMAASDTALNALVDAALADGPTRRHDDVAVLGLYRRRPRRNPAAASLVDTDTCWTYPSDPTTASLMRRDVRAALSNAGVPAEVLEDLLVAASEAVNNAVEHAQQPTRPEVEVRLTVAEGVVRIAVQDFGSWRGRRPAMDRGRGALLMNAYGDVRIVSTATGTMVAIERRL
jgi:signal transduction histidine kinase/DNA-binding response OmpR family regulator/serine phosphatase RsbU (regulator of sigma subunit)/anti-sigma regulatory factor (Ser/Thr protein kinase)